jgi:hypothetical protein
VARVRSEVVVVITLLNGVCKSQDYFFIKGGFQVVKHTNRGLDNTKILMIGD